MSVVGESVHIPGPLAKLRVAARAEPSLASVGLVLVEQGIGLPSHALFR